MMADRQESQAANIISLHTSTYIISDSCQHQHNITILPSREGAMKLSKLFWVFVIFMFVFSMILWYVLKKKSFE